MVRISVGALLFLIGVSRLCTCSPSSGFLWNGIGENLNQYIIIYLYIIRGDTDRYSTKYVRQYAYMLGYRLTVTTVHPYDIGISHTTHIWCT